ncbi:hypothetical protein O1L55_20595 [Streptomyces albulus]|nr:hypothetical protein [Streptomyces noursei]
MNLSAGEWDKLYGLAEKAAKKVAPKFPGITAEDITQDVMIRFVESESSARKTLDNYEKDPRITFRMLLTMGNQVASKEIWDYRKFFGTVIYSEWDVRKLLEKGLLITEERESFHEAQLNVLTTGRKSKKDFAEYVSLDDKIDLESGFSGLKKEYQEVIKRRYIGGESLNATERQRLSRAIESLTKGMNSLSVKKNSDHDGPGSRQAMSNATAQALTGQGW